MNLEKARATQNQIFEEEVVEDSIRQNFLYFLGNHPNLFQDYIQSGYLTNAEMNYIVEHFNDYDVDPRTFENDFAREMHEALPRYNIMKAIELVEEVFELTDDKFTRSIVKNRATQLAENGTSTGETKTDSSDDTKAASRELPMETSGSGSVDNIVNWVDGASNINENKSQGSSTIKHDDKTALTSRGTETGDTTENYSHHGSPVEHIDKIWQYLLKPKAIEYLTSAIAPAFILVY